jgi:hypothetical protein
LLLLLPLPLLLALLSEVYRWIWLSSAMLFPSIRRSLNADAKVASRRLCCTQSMMLSVSDAPVVAMNQFRPVERTRKKDINVLMTMYLNLHQVGQASWASFAHKPVTCHLAILTACLTFHVCKRYQELYLHSRLDCMSLIAAADPSVLLHSLLLLLLHKQPNIEQGPALKSIHCIVVSYKRTPQFCTGLA